MTDIKYLNHPVVNGCRVPFIARRSVQFGMEFLSDMRAVRVAYKRQYGALDTLVKRIQLFMDTRRTQESERKRER